MAKKKESKNPRKPRKPEKPVTALAIIPKVHQGPPPKQEERRHHTSAGWDPVMEAEAAGVSKEYTNLIKRIVDAKSCMDTDFFRGLYKAQGSRLLAISDNLLTVDKAGDLRRLQAEAKYIQEVRISYQEPVKALNDYIASNPLFSQNFMIRAEFNTALGKIELRQM